MLRLVRVDQGDEAADLAELHIRGFHGTLVDEDRTGGNDVDGATA